MGVVFAGLTAPEAFATTGGAFAPAQTGTTVTPTAGTPGYAEGAPGSTTPAPSTNNPNTTPGGYPTPGTGTEPVKAPPKSTPGSPKSTPGLPKSSTPHMPVTAKKPRLTKLAYRGAVYEKTATGQLVRYVSPATASFVAKHQEDSTGGAGAAETALTEFKELVVPGKFAHVLANGQAAAPEAAPLPVQEMIWAGNQIVGLPYIYGGGHNATFVSPGYDCSGTVSYALHGASLLTAPLDSSEFMRWGESGIGQWATIFTNPGHAYMDVAGIRLDTSPAEDPSNLEGPRWRPLRETNAGYSVRHPEGL